MRELKKPDVVKILGLIRMTWPNAYPTNTDKEEDALISLWYDILREYPYEIVSVAFRNTMKKSEFPPRPATVVKEITTMQEAVGKSDSELWNELQRVIPLAKACMEMSFFTMEVAEGVTQGDRAKEVLNDAYERLDPLLKEYCGGIAGLKAICTYNQEQMSYERGRFFRLLPEMRERKWNRESLPKGIDVLIQGLSDKLTLKIGEGKT